LRWAALWQGFYFGYCSYRRALSEELVILMIFEGDFGWFIIRAMLFALFAGIAGAIVAAIHNEFVKRS